MARLAQQARIGRLVAVAALLGAATLLAPEIIPETELAVPAGRTERLHNPVPVPRHAGFDAPDSPGHVLTDRHSPAADDGAASDDIPGSLAMDERQLELLLEQGFLEVLHPEGGLLRIDLLRIESADAARIFHVAAAGLPGVITERLGNYFATIATPTGVYILERRNGHTQLGNQQQLDLRNNPDARDYRHVPLA